MEENPTGPKRKLEETVVHMEKASSSDSTVSLMIKIVLRYDHAFQEFGFKGPSWLCCIPEYNFITDMSIDYMHCILLGVTRLLLRLWVSSNNHQELWYIGNQINIMDDRLCDIKPPNKIQRTPQSIEFTLKFWKGMFHL